MSKWVNAHWIVWLCQTSVFNLLLKSRELCRTQLGSWLNTNAVHVCVCVYRVDRLDAGYEYELLLIDSETTKSTNDSDKCFHFPSADTHTSTLFKYIKSTKHSKIIDVVHALNMHINSNYYGYCSLSLYIAVVAKARRHHRSRFLDLFDNTLQPTHAHTRFRSTPFFCNGVSEHTIQHTYCKYIWNWSVDFCSSQCRTLAADIDDDRQTFNMIQLVSAVCVCVLNGDLYFYYA